MTQPPSDRWRQISSLFDEAVSLPIDQRSAFLDKACSGDVELKAEVLRLLESADQADEFLEKPLVSQAGPLLREAVEDIGADATAATLTTPPPAGAPAERIGPYRLMQKIGEGGMGEVWLAEQTEPVRRRVALKLIKAGMDTRQVIARFEAERQALALMDHPAIAKVYEAGATPRGLPYFAMEHVAGEPITAYCDRHRLGVPERLELFERVCDGVQHAHQKGVIHRDLKPSNVLVAIQDGKPVPKIIDFGVAKATAQRLTEKTMFTELGMIIGTPEYMSPEQAELTGLDVDTRTDIYSLGVMLYELLTGALPFESKELRKAGYDEIRRRIREVDPPRPSTRISTLGDKATHAAQNRRTEPRQLAGRLRGDLDWIVMKALEKDRTRRYGSPSELAADLQRHLGHQPVLAGPPSAGYRAKKFVRRHRAGVAVATLAALSLFGFGVAMALQARRIEREYTRAERVSQFLVDLFKVSDPGQARGNSITAREVLDRGATRISQDLANEPLVQAQMSVTLGNVYINLGLYKEAEKLLSSAMAVREKLLGPRNPETLKAHRLVLRCWDHLGRWKEARESLTALLDTERQVLGPDDPETITAVADLGTIYERLLKWDEAGKLYRESLERRRRVLGERHPDTIWALNNLASNLEDTNHLEESTRLFHEVTQARREILGVDHPDTLRAMTNEARLLGKTGHLPDAEKLVREALEGQTRVLGPEHPATLSTMGELIMVLASEKKNDESIAQYKKTIEIRRRVSGPESPGALSLDVNQINFYADMGKLDEAEKLGRETYEIALRARGPEDGYTTGAAYNLGAVLAGRGRRDEALRWLQVALAGDPSLAQYLSDDPYLKSLRGDPEFERLAAPGAKAQESGKQ